MSELIYYWDSSVFLAYFNDEPKRANVVEALLHDGQSGKLSIVTSVFSFVEVIKMKGENPLKQTQEQKITEFFQYPFIKIVDATRAICEYARHLIWAHPALWPKDSAHLASAMIYSDRAHLDGLFSYDDDFLKLNQIITTKFPIQTPFQKQPELFPPPAKQATPPEVQA